MEQTVSVKFEVGQTIVYDDPGVWGYAPAKERVAVIVAVEPSRHHGCYLLVKTDGINLPKRIVPAQVIGFTDVSLTEAAEKSAAEAEVSAA